MKKEIIKIVGRTNRNKNLFFCTYTPVLDAAIKNFESARTVKVLNGVCYISHVSLGYFTEILSSEKIPFSVITTLN